MIDEEVVDKTTKKLQKYVADLSKSFNSTCELISDMKCKCVIWVHPYEPLHETIPEGKTIKTNVILNSNFNKKENLISILEQVLEFYKK